MWFSMQNTLIASVVLFLSAVESIIADDHEGFLRTRNLQTNTNDPLFKIVTTSKSPDPLFSNLSIPPNAATAGMWSRVYNWPIVSVHTAVLPDGKIATYGANLGESVQNGRVFVVWDPRLGFSDPSIKVSPNAQAVDSFCSSGVLLSDGMLLVSGGGSGRSGTSRESSIFNYKTTAAKQAENLNSPRWYGTMTKLPDGRALTTGGVRPYLTEGYADPIGAASGVSSTPEIYTQGQGWTLLSGGFSLDAFGAENNRYWYPRQWVSPTGTVFGISTDKMWELDVRGNGSIRTVGNFKTKPDNNSKPNVGPTCTAVMYDSGKILQVGGNGYFNDYASPSSAAATIVDITQIGSGNVQVTDTSPMTYARQWASSTILPDGKVLVSGGTRYANNGQPDAVFPVEIWNPKTGSWTVGASASRVRVYHQSAALLPNGAVFTAGGGVPGPVSNFDAEIYYPPYLFQLQNGNSALASRPTIISVSDNSVQYGESIDVQIAAGDEVSEVSFIALPSDTHSFDANQRRMKLSFQVTGNVVRVAIPSSRNDAPPGYYYINVVDSRGVPSSAVIIGLDADAPPNPADRFALEEINGAFSVVAVARFDNLAKSWQRIFDFGNGAQQSNVLLGQCGKTNAICFQIFNKGNTYSLDAPNAIIQGETATWSAGVKSTGVMWIQKNGVELARSRGGIPDDVSRAFKLIGSSNWATDDPLEGAVLGISVWNVGESKDSRLMSSAGTIKGAFTVEGWARFDDMSGKKSWQRVFDFGNGPNRNNIWFGQCENTTDICFGVYKGTSTFTVRATGAIAAGETSFWRVGVDFDGLMWIEKNGLRLAQEQGVVPSIAKRKHNLIGRSNWDTHDPLDGVVLGLKVDVPAPTYVLQEIKGAVVFESVARFDDVGNAAWQRIFDFGNGVASDNVLLGQCGTSADMCFQIFRDGQRYEVRAPGSIVRGETATWRAGVDGTGLMWIEKNGIRLSQGQGVVPADVTRKLKLIGKSNWVADAPYLNGSVLGISITNGIAAKDQILLNQIDQIHGSFTASAYARFDDLSGRRVWQRVFDFGNGAASNNVLLSQVAHTKDMMLEVHRDGQSARVVALDALEEGKMAFWKVGVDSNGWMWIEKNGRRLVEAPGLIPADVPRSNNLVGLSNWAADSNLYGVVLGLKLVNR